jgi:hypothetical protein
MIGYGNGDAGMYRLSITPEMATSRTILARSRGEAGDLRHSPQAAQTTHPEAEEWPKIGTNHAAQITQSWVYKTGEFLLGRL